MIMAKKKYNLKKAFQKDRLLCFEIFISIIIFIFVIFLMVFSICDKKYIVKFNSNGGSIVTSKRIRYNRTIKEPQPPMRDGYQFIGWYYDNEKFSFDTKIKDNLELEAKWKKIITSQITDIKLDYQDFTILPNKELQLIPKITSSSSDNEKLYWDSSDSSVVEVDSNGLIKTKKEGETLITVSTLNGLNDQIKVTVSADAVPINALQFKTDIILLYKDYKRSLEIIVTPNNYSNRNMIWESSDSSIVEVNADGVVTGLEVGEAYITVTSLDGRIKAKCKVNVIEA